MSKELQKLNPNEGLRVFDINWETDTAGPSPNNNKRIEVFLLGCDKAQQGNPCKGCFNRITWDKSKAQWSYNPIEFADMINEYCDPNNKYVTIGGGEPTDQIDQLIPFAKRLKEHGFHIMMYTWRNLEHIRNAPVYTLTDEQNKHIDTFKIKSKIKEILKYLDIVVDGEFKQDECLYQQELGDGMLSSIGSGNQVVWDIKLTNDNKNENVVPTYLGYRLDELAGLYIKPDTNNLIYITKK